MRKAIDALDHLLLGAADLEKAIAWFEERTGVRAAIGGSHPGMGTRNALVSLGATHYLEIIAPDPAQSSYGFQLDVRAFAEPRLVTWAASTTAVDAVADAARHAGLEVFGPRDGSRARPDGAMLHWRTVGIKADLGAADVDPVPFFIEWGAGTRHPSADSPGGCRLVDFAVEHPEPQRLHDILAALAIDADVGKSSAPVIHARLETPRGRVTI